MGNKLLVIVDVIVLKQRKNRLDFLGEILLYVIIVFTSTNYSIHDAMLIRKICYILIDHYFLDALVVVFLSVDDMNIDQQILFLVERSLKVRLEIIEGKVQKWMVLLSYVAEEKFVSLYFECSYLLLCLNMTVDKVS